MSKATLIIDTPDGQLVAEFDVTTEEQTATVTITPDDIKIHTKQRPTLVPIDETEYGDREYDTPIFGNEG